MFCPGEDYLLRVQNWLRFFVFRFSNFLDLNSLCSNFGPRWVQIWNEQIQFTLVTMFDIVHSRCWKTTKAQPVAVDSEYSALHFISIAIGLFGLLRGSNFIRNSAKLFYHLGLPLEAYLCNIPFILKNWMIFCDFHVYQKLLFSANDIHSNWIKSFPCLAPAWI